MATSRTQAERDREDRGSGKEGYDASVEALTEFQGGATLDDPEVGADDNIIPSQWSEQRLDERIQNGEGEAVRQELAEAAESLKPRLRSEAGGSKSTKSSKAKKDDER